MARFDDLFGAPTEGAGRFDDLFVSDTPTVPTAQPVQQGGPFDDLFDVVQGARISGPLKPGLAGRRGKRMPDLIQDDAGIFRAESGEAIPADKNWYSQYGLELDYKTGGQFEKQRRASQYEDGDLVSRFLVGGEQVQAAQDVGAFFRAMDGIENPEVWAKGFETMDTLDAYTAEMPVAETKVGRAVQGAAQMAGPMLDNIGAEAVGRVIRAGTGIPAGKLYNFAYWQSEGAGSTLREALVDQDPASMTRDERQRAFVISQAAGAAYASVEMLSGLFPGSKSTGLDPAGRLSRQVFKRLASDRRLAKVGEMGLREGLRYVFNVLEEGFQDDIKLVAGDAVSGEETEVAERWQKFGETLEQSAGPMAVISLLFGGGGSVPELLALRKDGPAAPRTQETSFEVTPPTPEQAPKIVVSGWKNGQKVLVSTGRAGAKAKAGKVLQQVDANTVRVRVGKTIQDVPVEQVAIPSAQETLESQREILAGLEPEARAQVRSDVRELDALLEQSHWWNVELGAEQGTSERDAGINRHTALLQARTEAAKAVGQPDADLTNPIVRAELLPQVRAYLETEGRSEVIQDALDRSKYDANRGGGFAVQDSMIPEGALLWRDGEWHTAELTAEGDVDLVDGQVTPIARGDVVDGLGAMIVPGDEAYDIARKEFDAQEAGEHAARQSATDVSHDARLDALAEMRANLEASEPGSALHGELVQAVEQLQQSIDSDVRHGYVKSETGGQQNDRVSDSEVRERQEQGPNSNTGWSEWQATRAAIREDVDATREVRESIESAEEDVEYSQTESAVAYSEKLAGTGHRVVYLKNAGVVEGFTVNGLVVINTSAAAETSEYETHEYFHTLEEAGDPEALALIESVDMSTPAAQAYHVAVSDITGQTEQQSRADLAADIYSGREVAHGVRLQEAIRRGSQIESRTPQGDRGSADPRLSTTPQYSVNDVPVKPNGDVVSVYDSGTDPLRVGDSMTPIGNMKFSVDSAGQKHVEWEFDYDSTEARKVNGRLARELDAVRRLFGPAAMKSLAAKRVVTLDQGEEVTRYTVRPHEAFAWLQSDAARARISRLLDPKVDLDVLARESGIPVQPNDGDYKQFKSDLKGLRRGFAKLREVPTKKNDIIILGDNSKAGAHVAFALMTCHPSSGCKVCYAAGDMYKGVLSRGVRNMLMVLQDPKAFGRRLAEEVKVNHPNRVNLPFFRLLGSGDMTHISQVEAFNELSQHLDRPIHIFSRHHDLLGKLKSSKTAPFIRMASVDGQLFRHYGLRKLANNRKTRGILTAFLLSGEHEIADVKALYDRHALALVLPANADLYRKMIAQHPELTGAACPCDADQRPHHFSCQLCAASRSGCFMFANELMVDGKGRTWVDGDTDIPDDAVSVLQFEKGASTWIGAQKKIIQASIDVTKTALNKHYDPVKKAWVQERTTVRRGVNINDSTMDYTGLILNGSKTVETRDDTRSLSPYVGKRVGIVRTGKGKATLVATAVIGEPVTYATEAEFRAAYDQHQVPVGDDFDFKGVKYGFPLTEVTKVSPVDVSKRAGRVARNIESVKLKTSAWSRLSPEQRMDEAKKFRNSNPEAELKPIPLKDLRWTGTIDSTDQPEVAHSYIASQEKAIASTEGGNVTIPATAQSEAKVFRNGRLVQDPAKVDRLTKKPVKFSVSPAQDAEYMELAKDPKKNGSALQRMVYEAAKRSGHTYLRGARTQDAAHDVDWMLFGSDWGDVAGYGPYMFVANDNGAVDASDLRQDIVDALTDAPEMADLAGTPEDVATEAVPERIVDSAGMWDNPDLVMRVWDKVLEPREISKVRTPDGLIVFDPSQIKSADPTTYDEQGNVIPLSQRFDPSTPLLAREQDDYRYMVDKGKPDAIEGGQYDSQETEFPRGVGEDPDARRYSADRGAGRERALAEVRERFVGAGATTEQRENWQGIELDQDALNSPEWQQVDARAAAAGFVLVPAKGIPKVAGLVDARRGFIVVNTQSRHDPIKIVDHELFHDLMHKDTVAAVQLRDAVNVHSPAFLEYKDALLSHSGMRAHFEAAARGRKRPGQSLRNALDLMVAEEMAANVFADTTVHFGVQQVDALQPGVDVPGMRDVLQQGLVAQAMQPAAPRGPPGYMAAVYHGSPHVWEPEPEFPHGRPRLDKIGTGEGAAAYGWGWYSAEAADVAKSYAPRDYDYESQLMQLYKNAEGFGDYTAMEVLESAMMHATPSELREQYTLKNGYDAEFLDTAIQTIKQVEDLAISDFALYKLDLPDDVVPLLLDWDGKTPRAVLGKLVDQAQAEGIDDLGFVQRAYEKYGNPAYYPTGDYVYTELTSRFGTKQAAAEFLARSGVPGNQYLDQYSRDTHTAEPTRNYVIWDQDVLDDMALLEQNGKALDAIRDAQVQMMAEDPGAVDPMVTKGVEYIDKVYPDSVPERGEMRKALVKRFHSGVLPHLAAIYKNVEGRKLRGFAKRMSERPDMKEYKERILKNRENYYEPQNYEEINDFLDTLEPDEWKEIAVKNRGNVGPLAGMRYIEYLRERGDDMLPTIELLAKHGTHPAQLLRQYAEARRRIPELLVDVVGKILDKHGVTFRDGQQAVLIGRARADFAARDALRKAEADWSKDFSEENAKTVARLTREADKVNRRLINYINDITPKRFWADIVPLGLQGGLLRPMSQVANIAGNVAFMPIRASYYSIGAATDALHSYITSTPRTLLQPGAGARFVAGGAWRGLKESGYQAVHGVGPGGAGGESVTAFRPARALLQAITGNNLPVDKKTGNVRKRDRVNRLAEALIGSHAAPMLRALAFGDLPVKYGDYARLLGEQATIRGLTGKAAEKFVRFPPPDARAIAAREAAQGVFQQENLLATAAYDLKRTLSSVRRVGPALNLGSTVVAPYVKTPANLAAAALVFGAPEVPFLMAVDAALRGKRREAHLNFAKFVVSQMMIFGAYYLYRAGVLFGDPDKESGKRRAMQRAMGLANTVNVSALKRHWKGEDTTPREGDELRSLSRLGFFGINADMVANGMYDKEREALKYGETLDEQATDYFARIVTTYPQLLSATANTTMMKGTADLMEAIMDNRYARWFQNAFYSVSTVALPGAMDAVNRSKIEYLPEMRGDTLLDSFANVVKARLLNVEDMPLKRDLLGRPILSTPEGSDPFAYHFLDVTKKRTVPQDPYLKLMFDVYAASGDDDAIPSIPGRTFRAPQMPGQPKTAPVELLVAEHSRFQELLGQHRMEMMQGLIEDTSFRTLPVEMQVQLLTATYSASLRLAKADYMMENPVVGQQTGGSHVRRSKRGKR